MAVVALETPADAATLKSEWNRLESSNFLVYSNANDDTTRALARELETFRQAMGHVLPGLAPPPRQITVLVFKNSKSFRKYTLNDQNVIGAFYEGIFGGGTIALDASRSRGFATVYHEFTHYMMHETYYAVPSWLSEGFAHYCETFQINGGRVEIGQPQQAMLEVAAGGPWVSYAEILSKNATAREKWNHSFRAQSWLLVHYLLTRQGNEYAKTRRFIALLDEGVAETDAFQIAFGLDVKGLDEVLRSYARQGDFRNHRFPLGEFETAQEFTASEAVSADVLWQLSEIAWGRPKGLDASRRYLEEALSLNPDHVPSIVSMISGYSRDMPLEEKIERLERAVRLDPSYAEAHLQLGWKFVQRFRNEDGEVPLPGEPTSEWILRAREAYRNAIEADPENLMAYADYCGTYVYDAESPEPGIRLAKKVLERSPNRFLATALVRLYSRDGNRDAALEVYSNYIARLATSLTEVEWESVQKVILRADILLADMWVREGRVEDALEVLEEVSAKTEEEKLTKKVAAKIAQLHSQLGSASDDSDPHRR